MTHLAGSPPEPVARSRRRRRNVIGGIVAVLLTIVASQAILNTQGSPAEYHAAYVHTGNLGDVVDGWKFSAQVVQLHGAKKIITGTYDKTTTDSDGVFVIVRIKLIPYREQLTLGMVSSHDNSGHEFLPTGRVRQTYPIQFEPGSPVEFDVIYEVPEQALTTLTVRLSEASIETRMATFADIRLNVTAAQARSWLTASQPLSPDPVEVVA